jgi:hypothetical protein
VEEDVMFDVKQKIFSIGTIGWNMIKGTNTASFVNVNSWNILIKSL